MAFDVKFLLSAEKDLEEIINYYNQINETLSEKLYTELLGLISLLKQNPFFEIKYATIRVYKLKSFPYSVHFSINENVVLIIAIAFGKQVKATFADRFLIV
jgi:hypothetical protein